MDAKPQRPLRAIRVRNDENMPPAAPAAAGKHTLHRNKSSPALSGLGAPKRTAFGDLSNIAVVPAPSKDDSILPAKAAGNSVVALKAAAAAATTAAAPLTKPAQRPLSVSGLKNLLTGNNNTSTKHGYGSTCNSSISSATTAAARHNSTGTIGSLKAKAGLTKPSVASTSAGQEQEQAPAQAQEPQATVNDTVTANTSSTASRRSVLSKRVTAVFKDADAGLDSVPETAAESLANVVAGQSNVPQPSLSAAAAAAAASSDVSLPSIEAVSLTSASDKAYQPAHTDPPVEQHDAVTVQQPQPQPQAVLAPYLGQPDFAVEQIARMAVLPTQLMPPLNAQHIYHPQPQHQQPQAPLPAEAEEYWEVEEDDGAAAAAAAAAEDEDEEEPADEDGYVTARSYRSKADTTTGATTLLFPKASQRANQELADAKQLVEASRTPEEIEDETFDTSMVTEYGDEIFAYMRELELSMLPNPHYMDNQHEIQWSMRSVLMDWLVQVHHRFGLLPETLFLCVNYIDRFLSCKVVSLGKLQLVGATAIFIAAKYEEINCPSVQEIVYMVDNGYTVDEILKAERFMLTMLQFELGFPGPMSFLRRISKADDYDLETRTLAKYFLELTIMDERFLASPPSFAAAASHCLARMMLRKGSWSPHHVHYSGYTLAQLRPLLRLLLECCENAHKHHAAVFNKYSDKRYKRASVFVEAEMQRGFRLPADLHQAAAAAAAAAAKQSYAGAQLQPFFDTVSYFHA